MAIIVLISCVSKKLSNRVKAKDIYVSPLFKMNLKFARSFNPDKIFILSAKWGLIDLDKEIEPYNKTLNKMNSIEKIHWANNVLHDLREITDLDKDEFIFLAGENYRKYLVPYIKNYKIPLKGLSIGRQLQYLKKEIK